jgi:hypothetical protein
VTINRNPDERVFKKYSVQTGCRLADTFGPTTWKPRDAPASASSAARRVPRLPPSPGSRPSFSLPRSRFDAPPERARSILKLYIAFGRLLHIHPYFLYFRCASSHGDLIAQLIQLIDPRTASTLFSMYWCRCVERCSAQQCNCHL